MTYEEEQHPDTDSEGVKVRVKGNNVNDESGGNITDQAWKKLKEDPKIKISKIVEDMLDSIVAKDLYNETGVGCDNMTCIVIVFKKPDEKQKEK